MDIIITTRWLSLLLIKLFINRPIAMIHTWCFYDHVTNLMHSQNNHNHGYGFCMLHCSLNFTNSIIVKTCKTK